MKRTKKKNKHQETPIKSQGFWQRFQNLLKRNGISVAEYAKIMGISPNTIYRRQRGVFSPSGELKTLVTMLESIEDQGKNVKDYLTLIARNK